MKLKIVQPQRSRMEMMPLIDSFFLILVYFIYAFLSMSVHKGISLDLPRASTAVSDRSEHCAVSVNKEGRLFIDKQPVSRTDLKRNLKSLFEKDRDAFSLYIFGDVDAPHGDVVYILNTARELGIEKVLIETNPAGDSDE
ncbi:MAG: ExbD/TolR family protein [Candidatus Omnitrophota bacterium]